MLISRRSLLLRSLAVPATGASIALDIDRVGGTAVALDFHERRVRWASHPDRARQWLMPPGSTMKPLTLAALLHAGKLKETDRYLCPIVLTLRGRQVSCSHPRTAVPMGISTAIAYSCNCTLAHFAERFSTNELPAFLRQMGLGSVTGLLAGDEATCQLTPGLDGQQLQLQALGEQGIEVTPLALAAAYKRLARFTQDKAFEAVREGMEGAVQFGTAQAAKLDGQSITGKTGSVRSASGLRAGWFAGFAPSRNPEVIVVVLAQGKSGATAAAPIARKIFQAHFAGTL